CLPEAILRMLRALTLALFTLGRSAVVNILPNALAVSTTPLGVSLLSIRESDSASPCKGRTNTPMWMPWKGLKPNRTACAEFLTTPTARRGHQVGLESHER